MDHKASIKKAERLNSKKTIHQLFRKGSSFYIRPFKVFYNISDIPDELPVRVLITVSKRHIKKAAGRNQVKRRIREAYRLNKFLLNDVLSNEEKYLTIALIYTEDTVPETADVRKKIIKVFQRLNTEILQ